MSFTFFTDFTLKAVKALQMLNVRHESQNLRNHNRSVHWAKKNYIYMEWSKIENKCKQFLSIKWRGFILNHSIAIWSNASMRIIHGNGNGIVNDRMCTLLANCTWTLLCDQLSKMFEWHTLKYCLQLNERPRKTLMTTNISVGIVRFEDTFGWIDQILRQNQSKGKWSLVRARGRGSTDVRLDPIEPDSMDVYWMTP